MIVTLRKNMALSLVFVLLMSPFWGCKEGDPMQASPDPEEPATTVGPVENLHAFAGKNRVALSWRVSDGKAKKAIIYWNQKADSLGVTKIGNDSAYVEIRDLAEGTYTFTVFLYDDNGSASKGIQVVGKAYGEKYLKSLVPRALDGALFYNGNVSIRWADAPQFALGSEVSFTDQSGQTAVAKVSEHEARTILADYKPGTFFEYRTAYIPEEGAIDTFYTAYLSSAEDNTFTDPLVANAPDPWVVRKDSMYYMTYTTVNKIVLRATDRMSEVGNAEPITVWTPPAGTHYSENIWAPEMYFLDGKWYIYFTAEGANQTHSMFVLENASPDPMQGQWQYKGELKVAPGKFSIDGTILESNGELYMIWSLSYFGQFLYITKMSNPWTLTGSSSLIASPDLAWEQHGNKVLEGPEILKNDAGDVFLIYSASFCETDFYCLGQLTLRQGGDPLRPEDWTKSPEPVFVSAPANSAYGPGHCSFFKSPDGTEDWILYHANAAPNQGCGATRSARMQRFSWHENGTPDFGIPVKIDDPVVRPSGEF